MIGWLNSNSGAVLAVLTLVYVVATLGLVGLSWWNIRALWQLDRRRTRPYVVFDLVSRDRIMLVVLRNAGATAAIGTKVSVSPDVARDDSVSPLVAHGIAYIAPGREFSDALDSAPGFFAQYPTPRFSGEISYADSDGYAYREPFAIDLTFQKDLLSASKPDIGTELEKIRRVLESRSV